jgi:thiol-disulfide isomerase/thioredoxin
VASEFRAKAAPSESIRTPAVSSARSPEAKPAASPRPKPSRSTAAASAPGAYLDYAAWNAKRASYSSSDVVLFFHASWCPKCRDTEASAKAGMPAGLTLVKVDYDAANDLRKKYGVTLQHTFVQIDEGGNALKKWVGTYDDNGVAWVKAQTV